MKSGVLSALLIAVTSPAGQSDNLWRWAVLSLEQPLRYLIAIHAGHVDVQQHHLGSESPRGAQSSLTVVSHLCLVAHPLEQPGITVGHCLIVVDTENANCLRRSRPLFANFA